MRASSEPAVLRRCVDLQSLNTLAVPSVAPLFARIESIEQALQLLRWYQMQPPKILHILGGGSNVVLPKQLSGLCLQVGIMGRSCLLSEHELGKASVQGAQAVSLWVGAGEPWHPFVQWTLNQGFQGLENLALIPGTVGAAPVQNIGAYGVEVSKFVSAVEFIDLRDLSLQVLDSHQCQFRYRDSIFKRALKGKALITRVKLTLPRAGEGSLQYSYPILEQSLRASSIPRPWTAFDIFHTVCKVRSARIPDPKAVPNSGSFFKNPIVSLARCEQLQGQYPLLPVYPADKNNERKLAAAWLIDQAGWKGKQADGAGVHGQQALVLTNAQRSGADQVLRLAEAIADSVWQAFGVALELEPQIFLGEPALWFRPAFSRGESK